MENFLQGLKRAMSDVVEKIEDIAVNKSGSGDTVTEEKRAVVEVLRPPSPELNPEDDKDDEKESKGKAKGFSCFLRLVFDLFLKRNGLLRIAV